MRLATLDPPSGEWTPPAFALPLPELLEQGRKALELMLAPAGSRGVRRALAPLMLTQILPGTDGMSDSTMEAFLAAKGLEYERHLADVPLDILRSAADALAKESPHFPTVADFFRHATPELEKRRRQAARIKALIDARNRPASAKPFVPTPERERLLGLLRHYETPGGMLYSPAKAEKTRARLAELGVAIDPAPAPMSNATTAEAAP